MLLEEISHHGERVFISDRAPLRHLLLGGTRQSPLGSLVPFLCSKFLLKLSWDVSGAVSLARPSLRRVHVPLLLAGKKQAEEQRSSSGVSGPKSFPQIHCYSTIFFLPSSKSPSVILQVDIVSCVILRRNT